MAKPRKLWSTTTLPSAGRERHDSQAAAYRRVRYWAGQFGAGMLRPDLTHVSVWVDKRDGQGWQLFERVKLDEVGD